MSWRRWKLGLLIAILTGLFTGLSYLEALDVITVKTVVKFALVTLAVIGKDGVLFLQNHPVDEVEDDREKQTPPTAVTPKAQ